MKRIKVILLFFWLSLLSVEIRAEITEDFQIYWDDFRNAVLAWDKEKVADMTHFPFETRGPDDSEPIIRINRGQFIKCILERSMRQYERDAKINGIPVEESLREAIFNTKTLKADKQIVNGNSGQPHDFVRVFDMIFKRVKGRWKWTFVFLEEPLSSKPCKNHR